jgi:molybdate transport system substrate-binding protein
LAAAFADHTKTLQGMLMSRIDVMCAIAFRTCLENMVFPAFSRSTGHEISATWNPTKLLVEAIAGGARADLAILTDEATDELAKDGILDPSTVTHLADAVLGIAVKRGARKPDVSTAAAFRQTLVDARSIAFSRSGASGLYFAGLIERLGIDDIVRKAAVIVPSGFTAERLLNDDADLAVQQISELMAVDGADIAGTFPDEYQQATRFVAAQFSNTNAAAAGLLLEELTSDASRAAYNSAGLVCHSSSADATELG